MNASYALDRWFWGYRPLGYHLTNIALHVAAVVLLYSWIRRLLSDGRFARSRESGRVHGAALFAVHPLQTELWPTFRPIEILCVGLVHRGLLLRATRSSRESDARTVAAALRRARDRIERNRPGCCPCFPRYDWLLRPVDDAGRRRRLWRVIVPVFALLAVMAVYRFMTLPGIPVDRR